MYRPYLFSSDLITRSNNHPFGEKETINKAHEHLLHSRKTNIFFLIEKRYSWMNKYINEFDHGIELGCGTGISELHINSKNFKLTDIMKHDWVSQIVDAHKMPFKDSSLDFIILNNAIHHLSKPIVVLSECSRVLKHKGKVLIQDVHLSLIMRILMNITKHESYSYNINVFDPKVVCNNPDDPWSANNALPDLLFGNSKLFHEKIKYFKIASKKYTEFIIWPLSGGVASFISTPNLNRKVLEFVCFLDKIIVTMSNNVFPLQQQIVLSNNKM